jgi:AraC-like DNA-binding protein
MTAGTTKAWVAPRARVRERRKDVRNPAAPAHSRVVPPERRPQHLDPGQRRERAPLAAFGLAVGASERTLSRLFRQQAGMSFPQWRTQFRRLQHALVLLADGTPVTTAALACGWSNPSTFIETFRRAFGATPGKFYADQG